MTVTNKEPDVLIASIVIPKNKLKDKSKIEPKNLTEYAPIALSVFIHIAILGYLSHQFFQTRAPLAMREKAVKPINSFLYRLSDYKKLHALKTTQFINANNISNANMSYKKGSQVNKTRDPVQHQSIDQKSNIKTENSELNNQKKPILSVAKKELRKNNKIPLESSQAKTKTITKQHLLEQLNRLNKNNDSKKSKFSNQTNQELSYQRFSERLKPSNQKSTVKSIFNPSPQLVPKSTTLDAIDIEHRKKQQITNYSHDISIQKGDDGNCSVIQDLTSVGIEGVSAIQHFKCGKTKQEKYFSEHMKATMKRYQ